MPGRKHQAKPGEPVCPAPDCERLAGFATDHVGEGPCLRHGGRDWSERESSPLPRRLVGDPIDVPPEVLATVREVLASARRAEYPFEQAWDLAAEAALSYRPRRDAQEWWDVLDGTRDGWREAYERERSRLTELQE